MGVFTQHYEGLASEIVTECGVIPAVEIISRDSMPTIFSAKSALWDTGADSTIISSEIVEKLALKPYGEAELTGVNGMERTKTYAVHLLLPTGNLATFVEATVSTDLLYDIVIGMDVISHGDFAITNKEEKTIFSFRFPSEEHIDFNNK